MFVKHLNCALDNRYFFAIVSSVAVISIAVILVLPQQHNDQERGSTSVENTTVTDGVKHTVPLDEIKDGGPPPDGIPSIDSPKFVPASEAQFVNNGDLVIGLRLNGETKAYPLFILVWHEIVNDKLGNTPVVVTYCPLCFTTQVFERILNGTEVQLGTSGKLYNSNLVMYDRLTGSYWSQALGQSIKGSLAGDELKKIPFDVARWSDWKFLYPDTLVLTTDTGYQRAYGTDPYGDYYTSPYILFPVSHKDDRMQPKEKIIGFEDSGHYKAYKISDLESLKVVNDSVGNKEILLATLYPGMVRAFNRNADGKTFDFVYTDGKITDRQTNSEWNFDGKAISGTMQGTHLQRLAINPGFWFEWVAFHPNTEVYQG
ncbi:MAG: DUF3179 domain-containing protein [Thaumarchaeota archaeon]|nr:DUF3179 domain-containing protein [Nitrososphaerota archaeon]